jgi:hypothetical protein
MGARGLRDDDNGVATTNWKHVSRLIRRNTLAARLGFDHFHKIALGQVPTRWILQDNDGCDGLQKLRRFSGQPSSISQPFGALSINYGVQDAGSQVGSILTGVNPIRPP